MLIARIMKKQVTTVSPDTTVRAAAALMKALDIGALPVCEARRPVGIVTDRDIVVRWVSRQTADDIIAPIMTPSVLTCRPDQSIEDAAHLMADQQIRRLVVVDDIGLINGIITLGDIALDADETLAGQSLGEIIESR